jgi:hypothetical protein
MINVIDIEMALMTWGLPEIRLKASARPPSKNSNPERAHSAGLRCAKEPLQIRTHG